MSHAMCHVSQPQAQTLSLLNHPVCTVSCFAKKPKTVKKKSNCKKNIETTKTENVWRYAKVSNILLDQKYPVHWEAEFLRWHTHIDRHTTHGHCNLETESADSLKTIYNLGDMSFVPTQHIVYKNNLTN